MGIIGLVLSLFGAGTAVAKSEYDAQQKMRSQYVREIDEAERRKMQHQTVSSDRPYNRVLEFDVAHARIREVIAEIGEETLQKWELMALGYAALPRNDPFVQKLRPTQVMYWHRAQSTTLEKAEASGFFEHLQELGIDPAKVRLPHSDNLLARRTGRTGAFTQWFKQNYPEMANRQSAHPFGFHDYITEYARKTAYDNGFCPECHNRNRRSHTGFSSVYDGQYAGNLHFKVDWWWGIPDQEERERLIEVDKEFP